MNRRWTDTALTAAAPAAWGSTYLVTTQLLPPDRPLWSGVLRALPAGLLLLAVTRQLPQGAWWWRSLVLGALNIGAFFPLLFYSAYHLPGGTAAVLGAGQPLIVAGLTVLVLGERPRLWALLTAVAALAGVGMVVLRPDAALDPLGVAAGLTGTLAMGTGLVLTRRWTRPAADPTAAAPRTAGPVAAARVGVAKIDTLAVTAWQLTAGGVLIVPLALAAEGRPPTPDAPALLGYAWLGLAGTALAYALWFRGVAKLPVTQVSLLGAVSPLTAAALGWLVLGQALGPVQLAGFALAVTATAAGQLSRPRRTERPGRSVAGQPSGPRRPTPSNSGSEWGGNSLAAASGRTNRSPAAGGAAYDSPSIQRTSSDVHPRPDRAAISPISRRPTRVSSS